MCGKLESHDSGFVLLSHYLFKSKNKLVCQEHKKYECVFTFGIPDFIAILATP